MGSSREYWLYAKECARWAAETKKQEDQDLFFDMAKAWTNIALVEGDVVKLFAEASSSNSSASIALASTTLKVALNPKAA